MQLGRDADDVADRLGQAAGDVDVVIDYLWASLRGRDDRCRHQPRRPKQAAYLDPDRLRAGPTAPIPSAALRAARLQIVGSGQGSVSTQEFLAEIPTLAEEIAAGTLEVGARAMPLADVELAWLAAVKTQASASFSARSCSRCNADAGRNGRSDKRQSARSR